jgi:hypothetical protein
VRYSEFVERVTRFRASSVTGTCAFILWDQFGRRFSAADNQDLALLQAFGARISLIAATHGTDGVSELARGSDLFRLAHEFLEVDEGALDEEFQAEERRKLLECWAQSAVLHRYKLTDECVRAATLARTLVRMMRSQWDVTSAHSHALPRAWDLLSRVQRRAPRLDPIGYAKRALGMEPQVFLRTAFLLLALNSQTRGVIDLRATRIPVEFRERWDIGLDEVLFVAERLSIHREDLLRWEDDVLHAVPHPLKQYAPSPLTRFPLIQLRDHAAAPVTVRGRYVAPCPGSTQLALQGACLQVLREAPAADSRSYPGELGRALEDYLHDFLVSVAGHENVLRVDSIARETRRADLIVVMGKKAFVIESKSMLGSSSAKSIATTPESMKMWEKIYGAYEQCACTIHDTSLWRSHPRLTTVTDTACLVCFDEVLCIEGTAFNALAACAGITKALGVERIETVTVQYLESAISWYGLERLFELISEKWALGKQGDDLTAFIANKHEGPSRSQGRTPPHLVRALQEILPGLPP